MVGGAHPTIVAESYDLFTSPVEKIEMVKDIDTAKKEFWDQVQIYASNEVKRFKSILEDLIAWSDKQDQLRFTWHEGKRGSERQYLVKYCLPGMEMKAAFWSAYPHSKHGATLLILADPHHRFPEDLREEARCELAAMDRRTPEQTEYPEVRFINLIPPKNRQRLSELMESWLARIPVE
jgi:hypothetical protein